MDSRSFTLCSSSNLSFKRVTITSNRTFRHKNLASPSLFPLYRTAKLGRISRMKISGLSIITGDSSETDSSMRRSVIWKSSLPWNSNEKTDNSVPSSELNFCVLFIYTFSFLLHKSYIQIELRQPLCSAVRKTKTCYFKSVDTVPLAVINKFSKPWIKT